MKVKRGYYDVFVDTCAKYSSNIAVRHYVDGVYKTYTYSELYGVCEYLSQKLQLLQCNRGVIGLVSERNIIAAAHKNCTTFMFVDPTQDVGVIAKDIGFTIIMTIRTNDQDPNAEVFDKKPEQIVSVFDLIICFYKYDGGNEPRMLHVPQHSFIALTSGSTGEPKHIQVPIQCIQPNIDDLTKMFSITPEDVIFFSTPLTFDPSMVEILLACMNGASLLVAPDRTDVLFPENEMNSITIWQTTPSKFLQYSNTDIKDKILSQNSTLKILALGGEPFNSIQRIKELKHLDNKTRLFTLYGVTEMSCWACIAELDLSKITTDREVPLGHCLSETELIIEDNKDNVNTGKIILVSKTRKCVILNKSKGTEEQNSLKFLDTGDIGELKSGTVYYRGRRDDIIKRFGHKVNLMNIEAAIMQCPKVKTCACLWLPKPMLLVVYFSSETISSQELSDFLKCKLDDKHWPDKIIRVDNLPTNRHGKISKNILSNMFEKHVRMPQTEDSIKVTFIKELKASLGKNFVYDQIKNKDFFALGGTSFLAVSLCNNLSQTCPQLGKLILPYLMTQKNTIDEIMEIVYKQIGSGEIKVKKPLKRTRSNSEKRFDSSSLASNEIVKKSSLEATIGSVEFTTIWKHDTGKCVDASPVLFQSGYNLYVTVGSHSGQIVVLDAITSELQATFLINSRIEAAVLCYYDSDSPPCGVVGGYDGTIICFCLDTFKENWRVNIGSMIKSKAACVKGQLYVASYDGNVRCLNILTGTTDITINICDQAISADLVVAKKEFVILGSLSGVCACIQTTTNTVVWRGLLGSPLFASPVLYYNDKYVVFAEVSGDIHCRTVEKGIKIWKYQGVTGNIFSSIYIKQIDKFKWQMVFGCHDKGVYSLSVKNFQPTLLWKTQLTSPVYSTPCALSDKLILAVSNNGKLCILERETGVLLGEYSLPSETFSTPVTYGDFIYVGCRDDHLYSIRYLFEL